MFVRVGTRHYLVLPQIKVKKAFSGSKLGLNQILFRIKSKNTTLFSELNAIEVGIGNLMGVFCFPSKIASAAFFYALPFDFYLFIYTFDPD
ncbi:hypothetical protein [Hugenholtzia roseola]|uniref:hypothetical protein n=1 Tax=Hugenholtzia roseola TaxID=1002 RepID=UPI00040920A1|nr:hypothetical protein [Hugenholtzia roseola]